MEKNKCAICNVELGVFRYMQISPYDFSITCEEHDKYGRYFQLWMAKKELGLPYVEPKHECQICACHISDEDFATIKHTDFNITCVVHDKYKNWTVLDRVIEDFKKR